MLPVFPASLGIQALEIAGQLGDVNEIIVNRTSGHGACEDIGARRFRVKEPRWQSLKETSRWEGEGPARMRQLLAEIVLLVLLGRLGVNRTTIVPGEGGVLVHRRLRIKVVVDGRHV